MNVVENVQDLQAGMIQEQGLHQIFPLGHQKTFTD
jgi:hypothetical protein